MADCVKGKCGRYSWPMRFRWPQLLHISGLVVLAAFSVLALAERVAGAADAGSAPTLKLEEIGKGAVPIGGPWQFHLGDDAAWSDPKFDDSQ
jgi:hypothetical protein